MSDARETGHWESEDYRQRMFAKTWRGILMRGEDRIIFHGHMRQLVAKNLGAGVVEISKRAESITAKEGTNE